MSALTALASTLSTSINTVQLNIKDVQTQLANGIKILDAGQMGTVTRLASQVTGYAAASSNVTQAQNAIAVSQTGLNSINDLLTQLNDLANKASNASMTTADRTQLNNTFQTLLTQIDSIASTTTLNGVNLIGVGPTNANAINGATSTATAASTAATTAAAAALSTPATVAAAITALGPVTADATAASGAVPNTAAGAVAAVSVAGTANAIAVATAAAAMPRATAASVAAALTAAALVVTNAAAAATAANPATAANAATVASVAATASVPLAVGNTSGNAIIQSGITAADTMIIGAVPSDTTSLGGVVNIAVAGVMSTTPTAHTLSDLKTVAGATTGGILTATDAQGAMDLLKAAIAQLSSNQSSMSASNGGLLAKGKTDTAIGAQLQNSIDSIQKPDQAKMQMQLADLNNQQSIDYYLISQLNKAASDALTIFR
jgi:flagellin-like hook-associated protein FlgL